VEWLTSNVDYVREIVKVIRATENEELHDLAQRIELLHPLLHKAKASRPPAKSSRKWNRKRKQSIFTLCVDVRTQALRACTM